jgi:hypothetical protein
MTVVRIDLEPGSFLESEKERILIKAMYLKELTNY